MDFMSDDDDDMPNEEYRDENMRAVDDGYDRASGYRSMDEDEMLEEILGEAAETAPAFFGSEDDDMDFDEEPTDEDLMEIESENFNPDIFSDDEE